MKTTSTRNTPDGQQTTVEIDGETVARFFGQDSKEMAGRFNNDRYELAHLREHDAGVAQRCETGNPSWTMTSAVEQIARAAIALANGKGGV